MKKQIFRIFSIAAFAGVFFTLACEKKQPSDGISPTFGSTGNPHPGDQTVTGTTTYTNPATKNSVLFVGNTGWSNPTCGSTNSITLKAFNGTTDVTLSFATAIKSGTYAITSTPSGTVACSMVVTNAPDQPAGILWYGKSGSVVVTTSSTSINAALRSVICTQKNFDFPQVSVSGALGCSQ